MRDFLLTLSGPQRLLWNATNALQNGVPVLQPPSPLAAPLRRALETFIESTSRTLRIVGPHSQGLDAIATALEIKSAPEPTDLTLNRQMRRYVLQVESACPEINLWAQRLLKISTQHARADGISLWYIPPTRDGFGPRADGRQCWLSLEDHLGRSEMHVACAKAFQDRPGPGPTRYWEALARELAGPDYELLEVLVHADVKDLLLIEDTLRRLPPTQPERHLRFAGVPFLPAPTLARRAAAGDAAARDELSRRIWKAQLQEFLPALESERTRYLAQYMSQLLQIAERQSRLPDLAPSDRLPERIPDDVEWGQAAHHLGNHPVTRRKADDFHLFRCVRNDLAHGDMLTPQCLVDFLRLAASEFRGEWATQGVGEIALPVARKMA